MNRRTTRSAMLTFVAQPWNIFEDDPTAGGGGGTGAPTVNEHGYPDATPVADMTAEHQAAYWKFQSRKHEQRANAAPASDEFDRLRSAEAELKTLRDAELSDQQRTQQQRDDEATARATAERERDEARAELVRVRVATSKGLTPDQASRLSGSTQEELEADADALKALFAPAPPVTPQRPPLGSGPDARTARDVSAGEARYAAKSGIN